MIVPAAIDFQPQHDWPPLASAAMTWPPGRGRRSTL